MGDFSFSARLPKVPFAGVQRRRKAMHNSRNIGYKNWLKDLVKECIPLDLQVKILTRQKLTKNETEKFVHVISLASHVHTLSSLDSLSRQLESCTKTILGAIRGDVTEGPHDPRSAAERRLITAAVEYMLLKTEVEGSDVSKRQCFLHVWSRQNGKKAFRTFEKFDNAIRYDIEHFYSMNEVLHRLRTQSSDK